jgi:hypothetical protein
MKALPPALLVVAAAMLAAANDVAQLTVTAVNPLPIARFSQTIELTAR